MSKVESFIKKSAELTGDGKVDDSVKEFAEILKLENIRQIKDQLATDLAPLQSRLSHIERQQDIIIGLLKGKLDLDVEEKEIMDLMRKLLEKES